MRERALFLERYAKIIYMATLLYNRTSYSFLQSALKVRDLFSFAKENGYSSIGIADQNVLYGFAEMRKYEKMTGIHAVYGMEIRVRLAEQSVPFVLYAKNDDGYRVLCRISLEAAKRNTPFEPDEIGSLSRDLVCVLPDLCVEDALYNADEQTIASVLETVSRAVPSVYIGTSHVYSALYRKGNELLASLCMKYHLPRVAFPSAFFKPDDLDVYEAIRAIDQNTTVYDRNLRIDKYAALKTEESLSSFSHEELVNSDRIASVCKVTLEDRHASLPDYQCPAGASAKDYLTSLAFAGLRKRLNNHIPENYEKRLRKELDVINRMGFANYFLIVYGMILFAKRNGITMGPGRGSAPGSLVAYCLGITHADPIRYGLIFERFLNPMRATMPDIDIDVPDDKREEMIKYLSDTYGYEHTSHIIAFGTYGSRQTVTDLGKVLNIPSNQTDTVKRLLPKNPKITLEKAYSGSEAFRRYIDSSKELRVLYAIGRRLEGIHRNVTTHAAGIVLSKERIGDIVPLHYEEGRLCSTQYTMEYLEPLGLIKFDVLGVINLSIIHYASLAAKKDNPSLDLMKIPTDDPEVYRIFSEGKTVSVFQSKSSGMKGLLRRICPSSLEELSLVFALYRPGPMDMADEYVKRKSNPSLIRYLHPSLEPVLKETLGIIVYQEQIMMISRIMAGFTLGEADILRKSVSKKKADDLASMKDQFMIGAKEHGYSSETAEQVFDAILKFAEYGFNKSHSLVYAMFAYQMAYLKRYYPDAFYLAVLEQNNGNSAMISDCASELKGFGISLLRPDIELSGVNYTREGHNIRIPFKGVKGISGVLAQKIVDERQRSGEYSDVFDAVNRIWALGADKEKILSLINAGAYDRYGYNRETLRNALDGILSYGKLNSQTRNGETVYTPGIMPKHKITAVKSSRRKDFEEEKNALGYYLEGHPVALAREESFPDAMHLDEAIRRKGNVSAVIEVRKIKEHTTKNGGLMAFMTGFDETAEYDFAVMPETYARFKDDLKPHNILYVTGQIGSRDSCLLRNVIKYEEIKKEENRHDSDPYSG